MRELGVSLIDGTGPVGREKKRKNADAQMGPAYIVVSGVA